MRSPFPDCRSGAEQTRNSQRTDTSSRAVPEYSSPTLSNAGRSRLTSLTTNRERTCPCADRFLHFWERRWPRHPGSAIRRQRLRRRCRHHPRLRVHLVHGHIAGILPVLLASVELHGVERGIDLRRRLPVHQQRDPGESMRGSVLHRRLLLRELRPYDRLNANVDLYVPGFSSISGAPLFVWDYYVVYMDNYTGGTFDVLGVGYL